MSTLRMRYTDEHGHLQLLEFDGSRTEEIMDRCAARFCAPLTHEDSLRYKQIVERFPAPRKGTK